MEEKRGRGRPKKKKMSAEQREEWYNLQWSLLQVTTAQIKPEAWNGTAEQKKEQLRQLQWMRECVINVWVRQLKKELKEQGEEVPMFYSNNKESK